MKVQSIDNENEFYHEIDIAAHYSKQNFTQSL